MLSPGTNNPVFLPTHVSPDRTAGYVCFPVVMYYNATMTTVLHIDRGTASVSARMARLEANPRRAKALAAARHRLGNWMANEKLPDMGLAALRLKAGLSQKTLADKLGTQQSNISRWEKSPGDMQYSTIKSLATALHTTLAEVIAAIEACNPEDAKNEP